MKQVQNLIITLCCLSCLVTSLVSGFAPSSSVRQQQQQRMEVGGTTFQQLQFDQRFTNSVVQQQPVHDVRPTSVRLYGLFGLGAPEIAIILIAAAFLLGPQKLAELGKDAGKIAGELKEVPKEFQAGLAEGEKQARMMKESNTVETPTPSTTTATAVDVDVTKKEETK